MTNFEKTANRIHEDFVIEKLFGEKNIINKKDFLGKFSNWYEFDIDISGLDWTNEALMENKAEQEYDVILKKRFEGSVSQAMNNDEDENPYRLDT